MRKQFFSLFFCCVLLVSCSYFEKKNNKHSVIEVDTIIDFNSIDVFPLFPSCDSIPSPEKQRICSQIKLSEHLYASLESFKMRILERVNDTVLVKLHVANNGIVTLVNVQSSELIKSQIPKLDSLINKGIEDLPKMEPGIKRGMPVTTEFILPIILKN